MVIDDGIVYNPVSCFW